MYKLFSILVVAIAATFSSTAIANANNDAGYQASIVQNSTNRVLTFEISWGGGHWERQVLRPGEKQAFWKNLNAGGFKDLKSVSTITQDRTKATSHMSCSCFVLSIFDVRDQNLVVACFDQILILSNRFRSL